MTHISRSGVPLQSANRARVQIIPLGPRLTQPLFCLDSALNDRVRLQTTTNHRKINELYGV